jgi:hypothetical protein
MIKRRILRQEDDKPGGPRSSKGPSKRPEAESKDVMTQRLELQPGNTGGL